MNSGKRYIDLIIFDLDGTLVDSREDLVNAVNFTLKDMGLKEKSKPEISSYIGRGVENLVRKSLGYRQGAFLKRAQSVFEQHYRKHLTDNSVLYPNVKEILEYFKKKRKAIVTNKRHEFSVFTLKALSIYNYFEDVGGGDDAGSMKPSSRPLDTILHRLGINKEKAIMVGDMDIDILAGKKAGITTCGVTYGIGKKEDIIKAKPDFIIDDIIKLKEIIY